MYAQAEKLIRNAWVIFGVITVAWIFFHYPLLLSDPLLLRDDQFLVQAVYETQSLKHYFSGLLPGLYWDIQPVRDFTFWLNIILDSLIKYPAFHLFNLMLGMTILWQTRKILKFHGTDLALIHLGLLVIAFHPLFNNVMAWTSNRKHLLAVFFIMLFLYDWMKTNQHTWKGFLYIFLALFSQPIIIFIPMITVGKELWETRKITLVQVAIITLTLGVLALNYWFYTTNPLFLERNNAAALEDNYLSSVVLKLSRVIIQIFVPISYAAEYQLGNMLNMIGLVLSTLAGYALYKIKPSRNVLLYLAFAISTLYPVPKWHVRDPYLLSLLLVSIMLIFSWIKSINRNVTAGVLVLLCFLGFQSRRFTRMWTDDVSLHGQSYFSEGGFLNQFNYANVLTVTKTNPTLAYFMTLQMRDLYPQLAHPLLPNLIAESYYYSVHATQEVKLSIYIASTSNDPYHLFFKAKYLSDNKMKIGQDELVEMKKIIFSHPMLMKRFKENICQRYEEDCRTNLPELAPSAESK